MSNDCTQVLLVEKLVDDEVSHSDRREAEAHVERCASCREHLEFLTTLHARARELTYAGPSEEYWERLPRRVLERIGSETRRPGLSGLLQALFAPGLLRFSALGATVLVLAVIGVTVYRDGALRPELPELEVPSTREAVAPPAAPPAEPGEKESIEPPMAHDELPPPSDPVDSVRRAPVREKAAPDELAEPALAPEPKPEPQVPAPQAPEPQIEDSEMEALQVAPAATEPSRRARENAPESFSLALAESAQENCGDLRTALSSAEDDDPRTADARYRLALCSFRAHESDPRAETLEAAAGDAEGFLAVESEGARADEIRAKLEAIRHPR